MFVYPMVGKGRIWALGSRALWVEHCRVQGLKGCEVSSVKLSRF